LAPETTSVADFALRTATATTITLSGAIILLQAEAYSACVLHHI
jgi:hypothetical protein